MTNLVKYRGNNSGRLHSHNIWRDCPIGMIKSGEVEGHYFFDDFLSFGANTEADDGGQFAPVPYYTAASDGVSMTLLADTDHGVLTVNAADADEDGAVLVYGKDAGFARFGTPDRVWMEGRMAQESVADSNAVSALGLIETNVAPTSVITQVDTSGVIDLSEDFVGWRSLAANGDAIDPVYQLGGQTIRHVGPGTTNAAGSGYQEELVASTFKKFGLRWDGQKRLLEYFIDGDRKAYYVVPQSATNFPFTNHLALLWAFKTTAATEADAYLDWWAVAAV